MKPTYYEVYYEVYCEVYRGVRGLSVRRDRGGWRLGVGKTKLNSKLSRKLDSMDYVVIHSYYIHGHGHGHGRVHVHSSWASSDRPFVLVIRRADERFIKLLDSVLAA